MLALMSRSGADRGRRPWRTSPRSRRASRLRPLQAGDRATSITSSSIPTSAAISGTDQVLPSSRPGGGRRELRRFPDRRHGLWAVFLRGKAPAAGMVGFGGYWPFNVPPRLEILFGLAPVYWGGPWRPSSPAPSCATASRNWAWSTSTAAPTRRTPPPCG